jgi:hypothetical protein
MLFLRAKKALGIIIDRINEVIIKKKENRTD